jgi:hypothetical protein
MSWKKDKTKEWPDCTCIIGLFIWKEAFGKELIKNQV